jgi:hypothetical protein
LPSPAFDVIDPRDTPLPPDTWRKRSWQWVDELEREVPETLTGG